MPPRALAALAETVHRAVLVGRAWFTQAVAVARECKYLAQVGLVVVVVALKRILSTEKTVQMASVVAAVEAEPAWWSAQAATAAMGFAS